MDRWAVQIVGKEHENIAFIVDSNKNGNLRTQSADQLIDGDLRGEEKDGKLISCCSSENENENKNITTEIQEKLHYHVLI